jgi:hypothetical protein
VLRVKGHAAVAGKPMRLLVQAVGTRLRQSYDRPWRPQDPRETRLVVIAEREALVPKPSRPCSGPSPNRSGAGRLKRKAGSWPMHIVFRETHGMEETAIPQDLGQAPAPLVVLSFSDSDLGAFGAAWHAARADDPAFPDMRLANLAALAHPLSVDTYVERTLGGARAILIRLIGGEAYWAYGLSQVSLLARAQGIALAVLPGDGRPDPRLDSYSTVPPKPCARSTGSARKAARPPPRGACPSGRAGRLCARSHARRARPLPAGGWHPDRGLVDPLAVPAMRPARWCSWCSTAPIWPRRP